MSQYFKQYKPRCRVKVLSLVTGDELGDISDDVISLGTNKAYGRAAGTWQILLPYNLVKSWLPAHNGTMQRYHDIIRPDDIVTIEMDKGDGSGFVPVMLGQVDRTAACKQQGPLPQRQVKITGQDAGKILQKHDVGWDISGVRSQAAKEETVQIPMQQGASGQSVVIPFESYQARYALTAGTAAELIYQLWSIFQGTMNNQLINAMMQFRYQKTGKAYTWQAPSMEDNPPDEAPSPANWTITADTDDTWKTWAPQLVQSKNTPIWSAMESVAHKPYNMLHTETDPINVRRFNLILERNPIDGMGRCSRSQKGIDIHQIADEDIVQDDVGIGDLERINVLCYWPTLYKTAFNSVVEIVMADKNLTKFAEGQGQLDNLIKQHGYCSKIIDDNFVPPQVYGGCVNVDNYTDGLQVCRSIADLYWSWYRDMHNYESGGMTIHLSPEIRCGHCLVVKQPDGKTYKEFLIEQVSHQINFHPMPSAITTLQVTRGQIAGSDKVTV